MDKLSLYDLLSFLLPGFVAAEALRLALRAGGISAPWEDMAMTDVEGGLLLLALSLVLGLMVHRLTFKALWYGWYRRLLYRPIAAIAAGSGELQPIHRSLNALAQTYTGKPFLPPPQPPAEMDLFDHAYYALEAADKIAPAKGFQSLYFFLRNIAMVSALMLPLYAALLVWLLATRSIVPPGLWAAAAACVALLPACVWTARFCRTKMVVRILWTYHVLKTDPLT